MKKPGYKYYYDLNDGVVSYLLQSDYEGMNNNGDYHYHNFQGPFDSFIEAKRAALKEFKFRVNFARNQLLVVRKQRKA